MTKKYLFLFDPMRTGYYHELIDFCKNSSYSENIDFCDNFYNLHRFELNKYSKKLVFFDIFPPSEGLIGNTFYENDLLTRLNFLITNNFHVVLCRTWEYETKNNAVINFFNNKKFFDYYLWFGHDSWFYYLLFKKYKNLKLFFNHDIKIFDFLYLNKTRRHHRELLWNEFEKTNILENSLLSNHFKKIPLNKNYELLEFRNKDYPFYGWDQTIYELQYNHSAVSIVSETSVDKNIFLTEKTWKPIIAGQIFIIHGSPKSLSKLHEMGFKTFNQFFDESYDEELDLIKRTKKIVALCDYIKKQDYSLLYEKCKEILTHNQNTFFNKNILTKAIDRQVLSFLEFADRS